MLLLNNQTRMTLRALLTSKRFYNPPTRKTWSKQHPDFRTRRPLVEPYNLGRLHPEKEWWKLPKKGLSPQTFMGFPDVAHIEKRGGSLYTHLMDGHTLCMVVYRSIEHDVKDVEVWRSLTRQALKLAMSLDPYVVSLLFLYFSRSNWYDHQFVATFTGRIMATLSEFKIVECAHVLMAMENEKFMHEKTHERVIRHAEALCLSGIRSIEIEDALKLLAVLRSDSPEVDNILTALGEIVEVSDISAVDEIVVVDALDAACDLPDRIDRLCVTRLFDELCARLEADSGCNHSRNIAILKAMATFQYHRPYAVELIQDRLRDSVHTANIVELSRYMYLTSNADSCLPSYTILPRLSMAGVRKEALKVVDQLMEDNSLAVQVLAGCLYSSKPMGDDEVKLLIAMLERSEQLHQKDLLRLYTALCNSRTILPDEVTVGLEGLVKHAWSLLPTLNTEETSQLLRHGELDIAPLVGTSTLEEAFDRLATDINTLPEGALVALIEFCSKHQVLSKKMFDIIEADQRLLPRTAASAIAVLELHEIIGTVTESQSRSWALDILNNRYTFIDPRLHDRLHSIALTHGIKNRQVLSKS